MRLGYPRSGLGSAWPGQLTQGPPLYRQSTVIAPSRASTRKELCYGCNCQDYGCSGQHVRGK